MTSVRKRLTVERIVSVAATYYGVRVSEIRSPRRQATLAHARHVAMWLARTHTELSLPVIGGAIGGRDHTTVMYATHKIQRLLDRGDRALRDEIKALEGRLLDGRAAVRECVPPPADDHPPGRCVGSMDLVLRVVGDHFRLTVPEICARSRLPHVREARRVAMWVARNNARATDAEIGAIMGGVQRYTVSAAVRDVSRRLEGGDAMLAADIEAIEGVIRGFDDLVFNAGAVSQLMMSIGFALLSACRLAGQDCRTALPVPGRQASAAHGGGVTVDPEIPRPFEPRRFRVLSNIDDVIAAERATVRGGGA